MAASIQHHHVGLVAGWEGHRASDAPRLVAEPLQDGIERPRVVETHAAAAPLHPSIEHVRRIGRSRMLAHQRADVLERHREHVQPRDSTERLQARRLAFESEEAQVAGCEVVSSGRRGIVRHVQMVRATCRRGLLYRRSPRADWLAMMATERSTATPSTPPTAPAARTRATPTGGALRRTG